MLQYPIHIGPEALRQLQEDLQQKRYSQILVLVDENTGQHCYPLLAPLLPPHIRMEISAGEVYKTLETCTRVWQALTRHQFDRKSLMINLGGGVIGDMGGFIAGTYKRGIEFVQVPTTLLSQVDASVGSKLGIDFEGFKNHIGLFLDPQAVYIYPDFLQTLSQREQISGFAEVIKHHLIADAAGWQQLSQATSLEGLDLAALCRHSVAIKTRIVESDPREAGPRKSLNFGHTIGHALESHFMTTESLPQLLHGEAIAAGMIAEAYISHRRGRLAATDLAEITRFIHHFFPKISIPPAALAPVLALSLQDKKNQDGQVMCTLLNGIGDFLVDQLIDTEDSLEGLNYYLKSQQ